MAYKKKAIRPYFKVDKLVTIHYYEFASDYVFEGEQHDFWELIYVDSGQITVECEKKSDIVRRGQLIFIKPMDFHRLWCYGGRQANIFIISFECMSPSMRLFEGYCGPISQKLTGLITAIMGEAVKRYDIMLDELIPFKSAPFGGEQLIGNYLEVLLLLLARGIKSGRGEVLGPDAAAVKQKAIVGKVKRYLKAALYRRISLSDVCGQFHYGKSYLCQMFKDETGMGIMQYYNALKVKRAKELLRQEGVSYAQIAQKLNFSSPQYFVRIFKRYTNMTPREYLSSVRE